MSDTPKFEVIDRRKLKAEAEEAQESGQSRQTASVEPQSAPAQPSVPATEATGGPRLVVNEDRHDAVAAPDAASNQEAEADAAQELPAPTAEESSEQKAAYDASAQRLEDLIRAQNPAVGAQPPVSFENLVQQFYVSAMIQMGAGTQEGQRPRIDILGARATIDLMGVLAEKTRGNLTEAEDRALQAALFEARMAFLELTSMISLQGMQSPPPPPPGKR